MLPINTLINKSYYNVMIEINNYNKINMTNIHMIVSKINDNYKFVNYIHSKNFYYIYLHTNDIVISNQLKEILDLYDENNECNETKIYFMNLISDIENCKKLNVIHIFQK